MECSARQRPALMLDLAREVIRRRGPGRSRSPGRAGTGVPRAWRWRGRTWRVVLLGFRK